jgi:hypothetical protein
MKRNRAQGIFTEFPIRHAIVMHNLAKYQTRDYMKVTESHEGVQMIRNANHEDPWNDS